MRNSFSNAFTPGLEHNIVIWFPIEVCDDGLIEFQASQSPV